MDIRELNKLEDTNYFNLTVSFLAAFDKITRENYTSTLEDNDASVTVKKDAPDEVLLHFKHSANSFANITLDFYNSELVNFRALILPVGFMKARIAKGYRDNLLTFLKKLAKHTGSNLEVIEKNKTYRIAYDNKQVILNLDKNLSSGTPYVSIWCEFIQK